MSDEILSKIIPTIDSGTPYQYDVLGIVGLSTAVNYTDVDWNSSEISNLRSTLRDYAKIITKGGYVSIRRGYRVTPQPSSGIKLHKVKPHQLSEVEEINELLGWKWGKVLAFSEGSYTDLSVSETRGGGLLIHMSIDGKEDEISQSALLEAIGGSVRDSLSDYTGTRPFGHVTIAKQFLVDMALLNDPKLAEDVRAFYEI